VSDRYTPKIGDIIRHANPLLVDHEDRNDLTVEWVGVNGNQIICAGFFATGITVDGKQNHDPHYGVLSDYGWGEGWTKVGP
jgi:hypothetical protein